LRKIVFNQCREAKELVGLSSQMTSLQELLLSDCHSLSQCPGLGDLVSLQRLHVESCSQLSQAPDLYKLTKLQRLNLSWTKFNKLLGLNDSMPLQELLVDCTAIDELPNFHLLRHLQLLFMSEIKPTVMPRFDSFIALEILDLDVLRGVRAIHGMRSLTRLKNLRIVHAPDLLELPELGDLMALQDLCLHDCCRLVGNLELPDLHNLIHLERLQISLTPVRWLSSLERLTQLRELTCIETLLTELPVLNGFDKLETIYLSDCRELTSLENMGSLPALINLFVSDCSSLTRLLDLRSSKSLESLSIWNSGVSLGLEDIRALAILPALVMYDWNDDQVILSELLKEMSLVEVASHLEAKKVEHFTTLQTDSGTDSET